MVARTQDEFKGQIIHSTEFKSGKDMIGKKVVVIGACTSGAGLTLRIIVYRF